MQIKAVRQFECPDCHQKVDKNKVKEHVLTCKDYRMKYLNRMTREIDITSKDTLRFYYSELELVKQKMQSIFSDSESQSSSKKKNNIQGQKKQISQQIRLDNKIKNKQQINVAQRLIKKEQLGNKPKQKNQSAFDNYLAKKKNQSLSKEANKSKQKMAKQQIQFSYLESLMFQDNNQNDKMHVDQESTQCSKCHKRFTMNQVQQFVYGDLCLHPLCKKCMSTYLENQYIKAKGKYKYPCPHPGCNQQIPYYQLAEIFGNKKMEQIDNLLNKGFMDNLINCIKCQSKFQFLKGKPQDAPKTTQDGKKVQPKYLQDFANNRFLCHNCRTQQCKVCKASPYHFGKTCQQFKYSKTQKKCRYCLSVLPLGYTGSNGIKAFDDICDKKQCQERTKLACSKILQCGHSCNGIFKEKQCLPCLKAKCALLKQKQLNQQNQDSYCNICFIEGLGNAPCIKIKCGHIFHYECLMKRLKTRWFGPRILFNFCHCPLCKQWIEAPKQSELYKIIQGYKQLQKQVKHKALKRLKFEKDDQNQKLTNPTSEYYKNEQKYAVAIYAYFQCWKCKKPYFGGRKNCADAMNDNRQGEGFKPEQLICPQCCPISVTNCPKHGKDFISFKCKFCCSIAQWFCWGSTHFCDPCHKRQIAGEYLNKIPKEKLPICNGPGKCPIGGNHDGNGETKSLGCSLCTNLANNVQNF